jgi:hypothetical protein
MLTRFPMVFGLCATDVPRVCLLINEVQQRLIPKNGETGWWGTWQKTVFNVDRDDPYITCPAEIARIVNLDICRTPVAVQNEWFEFLEAGIGLQKPVDTCHCPGLSAAFDRGFFPTAYDLTGSQYIRVYATSAEDYGKRIQLAKAKDQNGNGIYTQDGLYPVEGLYLTLGAPFTDSTMKISEIGSLVKDVTAGDVTVYAVDDEGEETFLVRIKPQETAPRYRRYYIQGLPRNCCNDAETSTVQVTCMAKLEFQPVQSPSDTLLIGCVPALIAEAEAVRYGSMDTASAQVLAERKEREAVKYLNEEITHYLGKEKPSVNVAPFGTAKLARRAIGSML